MNPRIIAIGLSVIATGTAVYLLKGMSKPVQQVKEVTLVEAQVLVAKKHMSLGERIKTGHLEWRNWPKNSTEGLLTMARNNRAMQDMIGRVVKREMDAGDPVRVKNLIKADQGGVMAAILPAGMRAITLSVQSASRDSGLILPNDRVDVIFSSGKKSETMMQNIRVLAIGAEFDVKKGEKVLTGRKTATLELKPSQVETVTKATGKGTIWLSLRSIKDANIADSEIEEEEIGRDTVSVTRFGRVEYVDSVQR